MQSLRRFIAIVLFFSIVICIAGCGVTPASDSQNEQLPTASFPVESSDTPVSAVPDTPSPEQQNTLTFLFFSDTHPNPDYLDYTGVGRLLAQAASRNEKPELILFGGDTVDDGADETQWSDFWQAVGASLDGLTTAAVAGNHDSSALLAEQYDYPNRAPERPGEGYFYSFSMEPVFFLMLDSNIMGAANQHDIEWLQNELQSEAARQADWRIIVSHHPMWPVTDTPRDIQRAETMREYFLPILEENDVALILCGHQHVYSRTLPMRGGALANDGVGIVQIIAASGDKASYTVGERDFVAVTDIAPNYLLLVADDKSLTITAFNGDHKTIDELSIAKGVN